MSTTVVSIVNWNTRDDLHRCLSALGAAAVSRLEIVVVDNASTDGSAEMVEGCFPDVRLIRAGSNLGFAGANNLALQSSRADYFLLLNPDVDMPPAAVEQLIDFLEQTPAAAAVAPMLVGERGRRQTHLYRRFPSRLQIALFWTVLRPLTSLLGPLRRRLFEHDLRGRSVVQVDQLPGAAMMIRGSALRTVGLLDAGYFMWWEDVDWCYRAVADGFTLHVLPALQVRHTGGASFAAWSMETRVFQFYRAFYRFLAKHRLHGLARAATPIIRADLLLKGIVLRALRPGRAQGLVRARAAVRRALRDMSRGNVPDFSDADTDDSGAPLPPVEVIGTENGGVDVVVVNWNGRRWLERCIGALRASTVPIRIFVVDNDSDDGSAAYVRSEFPDVELIHHGRNTGYAGGANRGLSAGSAPYAFVMNPDVIVARDHLERLRDRLDADPLIGAAQGKLFRVTPGEFDAGVEPRRVLDSAGHTIFRSRMVVDRGQGLHDGPLYDTEASVFSACGAALFLRRAMLEDLAPGGEYFSESFFAYKEDIDLGWRARLLGWDVRYVPGAVAHHVRAVPFDTGAWRNMAPSARRHSWKNHYLLIIRNDRAVDVLRALPFIAGWEVLRLGHALIRDRRVIPAYLDAARELRSALQARRDIMGRRRAAAGDVRRWFGGEAIPVGNRGVARKTVAAA